MKDFAAKIPGDTGHDLRVPRTLWSGTDVSELADVDLPEHWVLKPNHRSGSVFFGAGNADIPGLRETVRGWLRPAEAVDLHEWAYLNARPLLLVEEYLGVPGSAPADYKFYVFEGDVAVVEVHADRYNGHNVRYYTPDWTPLEVGVGNHAPSTEEAKPPGNFEKMLEIASELGRSFDFMRVDLYSVDGEVFFGELSPYPGSGIEPFSPKSFDDELGAKWTLPVL